MPAAILSRPILHRFFFALKPDEVTARRTHAFAERMLGSGGLLQPDRHHLTLALTDDMLTVPTALVERLLRAGAAVRAAPFDLVLDQLSTGYGSIALRPGRAVPPLRDLQAAIARAMTAQGLSMREKWIFRPHETLCYRKAAQATQRPIGDFCWSVTAFVLIHSHVGLHRHETIGRWMLRVPDDPQGKLL